MKSPIGREDRLARDDRRRIRREESKDLHLLASQPRHNPLRRADGLPRNRNLRRAQTPDLVRHRLNLVVGLCEQSRDLGAGLLIASDDLNAVLLQRHAHNAHDRKNSRQSRCAVNAAALDAGAREAAAHPTRGRAAFRQQSCQRREHHFEQEQFVLQVQVVCPQPQEQL